MPLEYIIYLPIVILISIYLLSKANNKAFISLFLLWLFGSPIFLNPNYEISLSFFGFDIQPNRFLFLILTPILYISIMTPPWRKNKGGSIKPTGLRLYEYLLIGYIFFVAFSSIINWGSISSRTIIANVTNAITFIVVYFCSKKFINRNDFVLLQIAVLAFASISVVVAVYQFFVNPEFFRLGVTREAFLGYYRSNGLFTAEYDQGLFLIISIIVAMSMNLSRWIKIVFITICCAGVFLTMHRLSWVALTVTFGLIWFFYLQKNLLTYILVPLLVFIFVFGALNIPWSQLAIGEFGYELITNRILADTLSDRFSQYQFSFNLIPKYPEGIGDYSNPIYDQEAYNQGVPSEGSFLDPEYHALIVHNGFLSSGVKYGILGLIFFTLFIITSIFDFSKYSLQKGENWYPLLMIMLIFLIFNLTNDFSYIGTQISILLAWLIGGYVSFNNTNNVGDNSIQPTI
jgi:hypothetical protein